MAANKWRFLVDRLLGYLADGTELHYVEIGGPSGVTKPTKTSAGHAICSMSLAVEDDTGKDDTGKVYFYNETSDWVEQFAFQS